MKLVRVDEIPTPMPANKNFNNVSDILDNFLASDMKYAKVVWQPYGYANVDSARAALYQARRRQNYPLLIMHRNGELYLAKKGA